MLIHNKFKVLSSWVYLSL